MRGPQSGQRQLRRVSVKRRFNGLGILGRHAGRKGKNDEQKDDVCPKGKSGRMSCNATRRQNARHDDEQGHLADHLCGQAKGHVRKRSVRYVQNTRLHSNLPKRAVRRHMLPNHRRRTERRNENATVLRRRTASSPCRMRGRRTKGFLQAAGNRDAGTTPRLGSGMHSFLGVRRAGNMTLMHKEHNAAARPSITVHTRSGGDTEMSCNTRYANLWRRQPRTSLVW